MKKNNYNNCKEMEDCTLHVSYDTDSSRMDFEDNFEVIQHSSHRDTACYFFTDCGQSEKPDYVTDCYDFSDCTEKDFRDYCMERGQNLGMTAKEIIQAKREWFLTWEEATHSYLEDDGMVSCMVNDFPEINGAKLLVSSVALNGYSQGDYCVVLYRFNDWLKDDDKASLIFQHYIYDSPIYARLEVDGEEFYLDEALQDSYTYDVGEIVAYVKSQGLSEKVVEWVEKNLPEYPEYI